MGLHSVLYAHQCGKRITYTVFFIFYLIHAPFIIIQHLPAVTQDTDQQAVSQSATTRFNLN